MHFFQINILQILYTIEHKYNKTTIWSKKLNRRCPRRVKYLLNIPVKSISLYQMCNVSGKKLLEMLPQYSKVQIYITLQKNQLRWASLFFFDKRISSLIKENLIMDDQENFPNMTSAEWLEPFRNIERTKKALYQNTYN